MLIAATSIAGSPGVSAWSLLLAAAWPGEDPRNRVLVEADTSGGVLAVRYGLSPTPGIVELISNVRQGVGLRKTLEVCGHRLGEKLWAVPSPGGADVAWPILYRMGALGATLSDGEDIWFVDCGRWWPTSPAVSVSSEADLNLIFVDAEDSSLLSVRNRVHHFRQFGAVGVIVVGSTDRSLEELQMNFAADKVWMIRSVKQLDLLAGKAATSTKKVRRSNAWRQALDLSSEIHAMLQIETAPLGSSPEGNDLELSDRGGVGVPFSTGTPAVQASPSPVQASQVQASSHPVQPQSAVTDSNQAEVLGRGGLSAMVPPQPPVLDPSTGEFGTDSPSSSLIETQRVNVGSPSPQRMPVQGHQNTPTRITDDSPTSAAQGPGLPPAAFSTPPAPPQAEPGVASGSPSGAQSSELAVPLPDEQGEGTRTSYYHDAPAMRATFKSTMASPATNIDESTSPPIVNGSDLSSPKHEEHSP